MAKLGGLFKFGYGVLDELGFFSPTEKALDVLEQKTFGDPQQAVNVLSKFGKSVKDEMLFTGLEDEILSKKGKVQTQELKDYLAQNKTQIQEVVKNDTLNEMTQDMVKDQMNINFRDANAVIREWDTFDSNFYDDGSLKIQKIKPYMLPADQRTELEMPNIPINMSGDIYKYSDELDNLFGTEDFYKIIDEDTGITTLGNNKDGWFIYRNRETAGEELGEYDATAGTLEEAEIKANNMITPNFEELADGAFNLKPKFDNYTAGDGVLNDNYKEILLINKEIQDKDVPKTVPYVDADLQGYGQKGAFVKAGHFPEKNIIVHARTNDKVSQDGKYVLHAEELQSDWSQDGRSTGFQYGVRELKKIINNKKTPILNNLKNDYNALSKISNIDEIQLYRMPTASDRGGFTLGLEFAIKGDKDSQITKTISQIRNRANIEKDPREKSVLLKQAILLEKIIGQDYNLGNVIDSASGKYKFYEALPDTKRQQILKNQEGKNTDFYPISALEKEFLPALKDKVLIDLGQSLGIDKIQDAPAMTLAQRENNFFEPALKFLKAETGSDKKFAERYGDDYDKQDIIEFAQGALRSAKIRNNDYVPKFQKVINNFDVAPDDRLEAIKMLDSMAQQSKDYGIQIKKMQANNDDIPSGPFLADDKRFIELGVKNLINHAIKEGYDKISFSPPYVQDLMWGSPRVTELYETGIPKYVKDFLKGTDVPFKKEKIFHSEDGRQNYKGELDARDGEETETLLYDFDLATSYRSNRIQKMVDDEDTFMDTWTITITPELKDLMKSGVSLYSPIIGTGVAGALASQMIGSEEDIITEEGI